MKYILLILLVSTRVLAADYCDIKDKKTDEIVYTYKGDCDQKQFGGPWGDKTLTKHVTNTKKKKDLEDEDVAQAAKKLKRDQRRQRIESGCNEQTAFVKELCEELLDR